MRYLLTLGALAALLLLYVECSGATQQPCGCTIQFATEVVNLECGQSECLHNEGYSCAQTGVSMYGAGCEVDGGDETDMTPPCVPYQACDPTQARGCMLTDDLGSVMISCDPTTRRYCAPTGQPCRDTNDCCEGHQCVPTLGSGSTTDASEIGKHCGS